MHRIPTLSLAIGTTLLLCHGAPVYIARPELVTFNTAISRCTELGGQLATFSSDEELQAMFSARQALGQDAWFGFHDRDTEGEWAFIDGAEDLWYVHMS